MAGGWPERFIYVTSASGGAAVNVAPLVQAGIERIAAVVILIGHGRTAADTGQADKPVAWFTDLLARLARRAGLQPPPLERVIGDAEDIEVWSDALRETLAGAPEGVPVVFNIKGGTKAMSIGGVLGCMGQATLLHMPAGLRPELYPPEDAPFRAPVAAELDLELYLAAYGAAEIEPHHRHAREAFYRGHAPLLAALARDLAGAPATVAHLNGPCAGTVFRRRENGRSGGFEPTARATPTPEIRALLARHDLSAGVREERAGLAFRDAEWARLLLQGGWLEGALFNRLSALAEGLPGVEVAAGVRVGMKFAHRGHADPASEIGEYDLALMVRSQLHVLEIKTGQGKGADARSGVEQLQRFRQLLGGPFARAVLLNPMIAPHSMRAWRERMDRGNIRFLAGPQAVGEAEALVRRLLREA